jgi:nicotinamide riboside kinase/GNAT superfamily N-acetyltransferase
MTRLFITTGAESSGKTTLARQLSGALAAPLVQEASRDYLTALYTRHPGYRYDENDLLHIARLQLTRESQARREESPLLVCDTDLLVIVIWSEVVFGGCAPALMKLFEDSVNTTQRHYLLCDWQGVTWEPDPLRENPHDRHLLFARYRERLETLDMPFRIVGGDEQARVRHALDFAVRPSHARLRTITRADIPELMRIRAAVRENVLRSTVLTEQHYREALECDGHGFVAEQDGKIIGFTLGNGATGNIWALFLDPQHEGHGHGRRLLDALVAWFWARDVDTLWLTTSPRTRAERFYRAAGWQQVAATPGGELRFELRRTGGRP